MSTQISVEFPTMGDVDKAKPAICPYNKYHRITALKFPGHVSICRKQYAGKDFTRCPFNARHEFPAVELDYHLTICPDKAIIEKELSPAYAPNVKPVMHEPYEYDPVEDWESEANHTGFSITEVDKTPYDEINEYQDTLEESIKSQIGQSRNNYMPVVDTSSMSKTAKKNFKRAQKRREKEEVIGKEEDEEIDEESKLQQIAQEYAIPGRPISTNAGAFVDWVSILNQYCQKNRINQPKYSEAANPNGGFGYAVVVTTEKFYSNIYCKKKIDAKHSAARAALLGLNIAVGTPNPCRGPGNVEREQELENRRMLIENNYKPPKTQSIPGYNPPATQIQPSPQNQPPPMPSPAARMAALSVEEEQNQWQVAGSKKKDLSRTSGNALRLAGVGRGRGRKK
ncbi:uncharacterized protein LOC114516781 [Dendronephthya gigantea]|uniref:uncharacterized protein LOC114516781 n=1 Tax=Dendronephthya gigantea TaxID=151771 RepID=UPI00106B8398|nr:uncharacterized protein LOC114516781 [Dendronephthya gigantea]